VNPGLHGGIWRLTLCAMIQNMNSFSISGAETAGSVIRVSSAEPDVKHSLQQTELLYGCVY
jgi:hypothetical protein